MDNYVSKINSIELFCTGMQPLIFSVREAKNGNASWLRTGSCVHYYRNNFVRSHSDHCK